MAGRTPNPGGGRGDGPDDPDDRAADPAPRAWLHPSELGARFDTPAAGTPAVTAPPPPARRPGRAAPVLALAAAALVLLVVGVVVGRRTAAEPAGRVAVRTASGDASTGVSVVGADPVAPVADATHTATVVLPAGRASAVCVDGGVVTAAAALDPTATTVTIATGVGTRATSTVASTDAASGLAYLTGVACPSGPMAMPAGDGPVTGARVHVLARPAGSTGVRAQEIRILAAGRTITADVGTGASVVVPIVDTSLLGAPVVDDAGALVGLVVAIDADGARVTPTAMVRRVVAQFVAGDPVVAGWLGVGLDESGTVTEVTDGSPAAGAGLRTGDTVYAADGRRTAGAEALLVILQGHAPGERITLTLERGGRTLEAEVTLGAPPTAG